MEGNKSLIYAPQQTKSPNQKASNTDLNTFFLVFWFYILERGTLFESNLSQICPRECIAKTTNPSWLCILLFHCVYNDVHRTDTHNYLQRLHSAISLIYQPHKHGGGV